MNSGHPKIKTFSIQKYLGAEYSKSDDALAVEEPMEIRIVFGPADQRTMRSLSVTMRTPGNDEELAIGFLYSEGILDNPRQIVSTEFRGVDDAGTPTNNIVRVNLRSDVEIDFAQLQRNFLTTSSCGVCGKTSLESLDVKGVQSLSNESPPVSREVIYRLPHTLRSSQPTFDQTGGIHAACLADTSGKVLETREDVGRHNAVDKLLGVFFQRDELPASQRIMVVSGRASFELVQKAIVAGVPMMIAVGAPSSLAVDLARKYQMTLVGFASNSRFNVYSCEERIA